MLFNSNSHLKSLPHLSLINIGFSWIELGEIDEVPTRGDSDLKGARVTIARIFKYDQPKSSYRYFCKDT